jgi:hypothetical protein
MIRISDFYNKFLPQSNWVKLWRQYQTRYLEKYIRLWSLTTIGVVIETARIFCAVRVEGKETVERQECQL